MAPPVTCPSELQGSDPSVTKSRRGRNVGRGHEGSIPVHSMAIPHPRIGAVPRRSIFTGEQLTQGPIGIVDDERQRWLPPVPLSSLSLTAVRDKHTSLYWCGSGSDLVWPRDARCARLGEEPGARPLLKLRRGGAVVTAIAGRRNNRSLVLVAAKRRGKESARGDNGWREGCVPILFMRRVGQQRSPRSPASSIARWARSARMSRRDSDERPQPTVTLPSGTTDQRAL
jgi:hypothetical protein